MFLLDFKYVTISVLLFLL